MYYKVRKKRLVTYFFLFVLFFFITVSPLNNDKTQLSKQKAKRLICVQIVTNRSFLISIQIVVIYERSTLQSLNIFWVLKWNLTDIHF